MNDKAILEEAHLRLDSALAAANKQGFLRGLLVAERICGWLTQQPDTKRQQRTREWAEMALETAYLSVGAKRQV